MNDKMQVSADLVSVGKVIIEILKSEIAGVDYSVPADIDFNKLFKFADMHRVVPLIANTIIASENVPADIKAKFKKELFKVSMRYETQMKEKEALSQLFSENDVKHCFLKGHKLSKYYKNPELRFMLDMDVWVEKDSIAKAEEILKSRGYEKNSVADDKDISYLKRPFLNIEIHKELKYDYDKGYEYYKGAFSRLQSEDGSCELNMTNEDFYVYILSHSAHHFATAGTGIKNVLDHYYLEKYLKPLCDETALKAGFTATGLSVFNGKMDALSEYWFEDGECNDDIEEMAEYIMLSGVYGNQTNYYLGGILRGAYSEKKSSFILSRLFPSRAVAQDRFPILKKFPFLLPFVWIVRIISAVFSKKDYSSELDSASAVTQEDKNDFKHFIEKNGL